MDDQTIDVLDNRERGLDRTASVDLPTMVIADLATRKLAEVIQRNPVPPTSGDATTVADANHQALWFMAVIAFRAARSALWVIRVGYKDQAVVYVRLIDELHNRAQRVRGDPGGEYARQWLAGRSQGKGAKLAGQQFWEFLSGPAHANARAVFDWLALPSEDGSARVVLGPERRPEVTNATLIYIAGEIRDIAAMLIGAVGNALDDLTALTAAIKAGEAEHWGPDGGDLDSPDRDG